MRLSRSHNLFSNTIISETLLWWMRVSKSTSIRIIASVIHPITLARFSHIEVINIEHSPGFLSRSIRIGPNRSPLPSISALVNLPTQPGVPLDSLSQASTLGHSFVTVHGGIGIVHWEDENRGRRGHGMREGWGWGVKWRL
jgi:hypothetical protein